MLAHIQLPPTTRIRFVSDLHLGQPRADAKCADDLAFLLEDIDVLIVCGDMSETREGVFYEAGSQERARFFQMAAERGVELIPLAGNHDPDEEISVLKLNESIYSLHGHALYKQVAPWGFEYLRNKELAHDLIDAHPHADRDLEARMILAKEMSKSNLPIIEHRPHYKNKLVKFFLHAAWPPERPIRILLAWLNMFRLMDRFGGQFFGDAKLIVFGHFHRRAIARKNGRLMVNLGAAFKNANAYVLDLRDDQIILREYSVQQGFQGEGRILSLD